MNIDIKIIYDTREKNTEYIDKFEVDKRRRKDGTKIIEVERNTVKPLGATKSTGDLTYEYRIDDGEWIKSSLSIELKRDLDMFTSIYTKTNYDRLIREITRAKEYDLDFYFISDTPIDLLVEKVKKMESNPRIKKIKYNSNIIFLNKYLKLNEDIVDIGYKQGILCSGKDVWSLIRRLIKNNLKNELKAGK